MEFNIKVTCLFMVVNLILFKIMDSATGMVPLHLNILLSVVSSIYCMGWVIVLLDLFDVRKEK